jgi:hypothetical protein
VQAGDIVYVDRNAKPEPGDLCSFALSSRGVEAQNSALPKGQMPWATGARWIKMLAHWHGLDMLLDRHGNAAAATLLACESPDDVPALHPVRNVRRRGRLLFGPGIDTPTLTRRALLLGSVAAPLALAGCGDDAMPFAMLPACSDDAHGAQLGAQAATAVHTASLTTVNVGFAPTTVVVVNVPALASTATLIATAVFDLNVNTGAFGGNADIFSTFYGSGSATCGITSTQGILRFTIQCEYAANIGDAPDIKLIAFSANTSGTALTVSNVLLQVEVVKR